MFCADVFSGAKIKRRNLTPFYDVNRASQRYRLHRRSLLHSLTHAFKFRRRRSPRSPFFDGENLPKMPPALYSFSISTYAVKSDIIARRHSSNNGIGNEHNTAITASNCILLFRALHIIIVGFWDRKRAISHHFVTTMTKLT